MTIYTINERYNKDGVEYYLELPYELKGVIKSWGLWSVVKMFLNNRAFFVKDFAEIEVKKYNSYCI